MKSLSRTAQANYQVAVLPWKRKEDGTLSVMLITSRTNGKWMLPKGWPMEGKSDAQAALQEAQEEAGLDGEVSEIPLGSYHFIKLFDDGSTKPSQAIIYSLRVTKQRRRWKEKVSASANGTLHLKLRALLMSQTWRVF